MMMGRAALWFLLGLLLLALAAGLITGWFYIFTRATDWGRALGIMLILAAGAIFCGIGALFSACSVAERISITPLDSHSQITESI